jgi:hypothetical protein
VIVPAARNSKQDSRITMEVIFDFDALDEVPSLADPHQADPQPDPYQAEPTRPSQILIGQILNQILTRPSQPVEEMEFCLCGGKYEGDQCQREDCPHYNGAYKSRQAALLQELRNQGQLDNRYPHITP